MAQARGRALLVSSHPPSRPYLAGAVLASVAAAAGILAAVLHAVGASGTTGALDPENAAAALAPDGATRTLLFAGAFAPLAFWASRAIAVRRHFPDLVLAVVAVPLASLALAGIGGAAPAGPFAYTAIAGGLVAVAWLRRPAGVALLEGGLRVGDRTILWRDVRGYSTLAIDHQWNGRRVGSTYRATLLLIDGTALQLAPGVARAAPLCDALEATLGARLWRDGTERLAQGLDASFGALVLEPDGIRVGRRTLGWLETRAATMERDHLSIHARGQSRPWARLRKRDVTAPNVAWRMIDLRITSATAFTDAAEAAAAAAPPPLAQGGMATQADAAAEAAASPPAPAPGAPAGDTVALQAALEAIRADAGPAETSDASIAAAPARPADPSPAAAPAPPAEPVKSPAEPASAETEGERDKRAAPLAEDATSTPSPR